MLSPNLLFVWVALVSWYVDCQMLACFINGAMSAPLARSNNLKFCAGQDKNLIFGNFAGNGRSNCLCHSGANGKLELFNLPTAQVFPLSQEFCKDGVKVVPADINGDSRDDLVCLDAEGKVSYLLNSQTGGFYEAVMNKMESSFFHKNQHKTFFVGDLNNDGKDDIICHENGTIRYALSNNSRNDNTYFNDINIVDLTWCNGSDDVILEGDFDNDGSINLLCHASGKTLHSMLSFSSTNPKTFEVMIFENAVQFCEDPNSFILVGDINGDRYKDLVCKSKTSYGLTQILMNKPTMYFADQRIRYEFSFCTNGKEKNFFLSDVDKDGKGDLICQTDTGIRYVFLSRCSS